MKTSDVNNLIFQNGVKNTDFIVFNPLGVELNNEEPVLQEVLLNKDKFWDELKSKIWSSGCRFFFIMNEKQMIIGSIYTDTAFVTNLSKQIFEIFLNFLQENK